LLSSSEATSRANTLFNQLGCISNSTQNNLECAQQKSSDLLTEKTYVDSLLVRNDFDRLVIDNG